MIDFRYHLVSIVAVFLALAIGIVLGSTELQGTTIDGLRQTSNAQKSELNSVSAERDSYEQQASSYAQQASAANTFLQSVEQKLVAGLLPGRKLVIVTEPDASSAVISGVEQAAGLAGATVTGKIALQPKFNEVSGAARASLNAINAQLAQTDGITLAPAAASQTIYQQQAAQLIAAATLEASAGQAGRLTAAAAQALLYEYEQAGYLAVTGTVTDPATLAVLVTPQAAPSDGASDPANQVLLAIAAPFAEASAATLVAGSEAGSAASGSAMSALRGSSVSSLVSSVDNADETLGQVSVVWALADQVAGAKPNSYGISGASAISPVPLPAASAAATAPASPSLKPTQKPSSQAAKKTRSTVKTK